MNLMIPPLRYEFVYRLKQDFPDLTIVLNGGVKGDDEIARHLALFDGVMIGREAYHDPWCMADWDARFLGGPVLERTRESVEAQMVEYLERLQASEHHWSQASRHMLGLWNSVKGCWPPGVVGSQMKTLAPTGGVAPGARGRERPVAVD